MRCSQFSHAFTALGTADYQIIDPFHDCRLWPNCRCCANRAAAVDTGEELHRTVWRRCQVDTVCTQALQRGLGDRARPLGRQSKLPHMDNSCRLPFPMAPSRSKATSCGRNCSGRSSLTPQIRLPVPTTPCPATRNPRGWHSVAATLAKDSARACIGAVDASAIEASELGRRQTHGVPVACGYVPPLTSMRAPVV